MTSPAPARRRRKKPVIPGQSANPRGKSYLRRVGCMLNMRDYPHEEFPIQVLDYMRRQSDSNGVRYTDRYIIMEALRALGEKLDGGFQPGPNYIDGVSEIVIDQIAQRVCDKLGNIAIFTAPSQQQVGVTKQVIKTNTSLDTAHLTSESYAADPDEYDDEWN